MAKTIMIVDDSAALREVVTIALKGEGYDYVEAIDGVDALKKLSGQKIQLFVIDINMPNMDGITFMKEVKKMPNYKFTPFIVLTTEANEAKKNTAKEAGAKAWVHKPFQVATLLAAIAKFVVN